MFDFLFNPQGRISRKGYGLGFLLPYILLVTLPGILLPTEGVVAIYLTVTGLFFLWPSVIAVPFKRFHDLGITGWAHIGVVVVILLLTLFAFSELIMQSIGNPEIAEEMQAGGSNPIASIATTWGLIDDPARRIAFALATVIQYGEQILLLVLPGQRQANRFGEDPTIGGRGFAD
jgi:uncharacterized membrane protein YhaH (DUF805 family)